VRIVGASNGITPRALESRSFRAVRMSIVFVRPFRTQRVIGGDESIVLTNDQIVNFHSCRYFLAVECWLVRTLF
jgi:hypothetical protein